MSGVDSIAAHVACVAIVAIVARAAGGHAGEVFAAVAEYVTDMSCNFGLASFQSGHAAMPQIASACERPAGNRATILSRCC